MGALPTPEPAGLRFAPYIKELQEHFAVSGLSYGSAEDILAVTQRLRASETFAADLSSLVRSFILREGGDVPHAELLEILALAISGPAVEAAPQQYRQQLRQLLSFISGVLRRPWNMPPGELVPFPTDSAPMPTSVQEGLDPSPLPDPDPDPISEPSPVPDPVPPSIPEPTPFPSPVPDPIREPAPMFARAAAMAAAEASAVPAPFAAGLDPSPVPEPIPTPVPEPSPYPDPLPPAIPDPMPFPNPVPDPLPEPAPSFAWATDSGTAPWNRVPLPVVPPVRTAPTRHWTPPTWATRRNAAVAAAGAVALAAVIALAAHVHPSRRTDPPASLTAAAPSIQRSAAPGSSTPPPSAGDMASAAAPVRPFVNVYSARPTRRSGSDDQDAVDDTSYTAPPESHYAPGFPRPSAASQPASAQSAPEPKPAATQPAAAPIVRVSDSDVSRPVAAPIVVASSTPSGNDPGTLSEARSSFRDWPGLPARSSSHSASANRSGTFNVSSGVMASNLISAPNPDYPAIARLAHVQGQVILQAVIARNGTVSATHVLSGHRLLRGAAVDAVRRWRYKPYRVEGQPVDVATIVTVDFHASE